ncbi:MAG: hypothetical protein HYU04_02495 [Candidatus Wildermuthbacteria bacterium]|nr:hypothetical protein [Candidatus Wildermuthbacteria bacterium]
MRTITSSDLRIIDRQIEDGVLTKVNGNLPDVRCGMIVCGDMRHREDIEEFFGRKLSPNIHAIKIPGGAIEFSSRSPRNRRYPGDLDANMRSLVRAITAQELRHIILLGHMECGAATLDGLSPIQTELLTKDAKLTIIDRLTHDTELPAAVNGVNFWKPGEKDISAYLHCFADGLPFTKYLTQERTAWFLTHGVPAWVAQHYPEAASKLFTP